MWVLVVYGKIGLNGISSGITEAFLPVLSLGEVAKGGLYVCSFSLSHC